MMIKKPLRNKAKFIELITFFFTDETKENKENEQNEREKLACLLEDKEIRERLEEIMFKNPMETSEHEKKKKTTSQKEYILRAICPRPFLYHEEMESSYVVNRMYAAFNESTVRFALTLGESEF